MIADIEAAHAKADLLHHARALMAENHRLGREDRAERTVKRKVGLAHSRCDDSDPDFSGLGSVEFDRFQARHRFVLA